MQMQKGLYEVGGNCGSSSNSAYHVAFLNKRIKVKYLRVNIGHM